MNSTQVNPGNITEADKNAKKLLFWGCFMVLIATVFGFVQDKQLDQNLASYDQRNNTELHSTYVTEQKTGLFGSYKALDENKALPLAEY